MTHSVLKSCGHLGKRILDLGASALADDFPLTTDDATAQTEHELALNLCYGCGMVELTQFVDDRDLFGDRYAFFSGASPVLEQHFYKYAHWIKHMFAEEIDRGVVEIACNDGTLLHHFRHSPHLGIDPALPAESAIKAGLNVVRKPFIADDAGYIRDAVGGGDVGLVIANNVIAHVPEFQDFLYGIKHLIGVTGVAILEFQYLPDLILGNQFDLVYHEHRRYLSLRALDYHLAGNDMHIVDAMPIDMQGGSVRVVIMSRKMGMKTPEAMQMMEREEFSLSRTAFESFAERVDVLRGMIHEQVMRLAADRTVALYGAPAKATTLLTATGLGHEQIRYAVDLTPYKIGKFMPGSWIPVIGPDEERGLAADSKNADVYLLGITNYLGSVLRREREFVKRGGNFLLPLPKPVLI